jgi:hypothetical protein
MDQRMAWSGAGGVIAATSGTNAVAWAIGAASANSPLPSWPAFMFGIAALVGVYLLVAALGRLWPLNRLSMTPAEVLDEHIRSGRQARRDALELDEEPAARILGRWESTTLDALDRNYPLVAERFLGARGDDENLSGQALVVNTIATKVGVLESARESQTE